MRSGDHSVYIARGWACGVDLVQTNPTRSRGLVSAESVPCRLRSRLHSLSASSPSPPPFSTSPQDYLMLFLAEEQERGMPAYARAIAGNANYGYYKSIVDATLMTHQSARNNVFLPDFSEDCVACLCDASTACNLTIGCFAGLCGPFLIGRQYWLDAGAPVLPGATWQSKNAYESCTMDPNCATSTIFNYMTRFARDCNGDGSISCDDYARIHYLGGNQCHVPIKNYAYYRIFQQCMAQVNREEIP